SRDHEAGAAAAAGRAQKGQLLVLLQARRFPVGSEDDVAGEVLGGVGLEVRFERGEIESAVGVERRDEGGKDSPQHGGRTYVAGVFLASAAATRSRSFTSWGVKASRKSLQISSVAHSPASVRMGATAALPVASPTAPHWGEVDRSDTTVVVWPCAASASGPPPDHTRSGPAGRSSEVCTTRSSPSATYTVTAEKRAKRFFISSAACRRASSKEAAFFTASSTSWRTCSLRAADLRARFVFHGLSSS